MLNPIRSDDFEHARRRKSLDQRERVLTALDEVRRASAAIEARGLAELGAVSRGDIAEPLGSLQDARARLQALLQRVEKSGPLA